MCIYLLLPDTRMFCCKGYCMDLLRELSKTVNFTYNVTLSPDGQFGSYVIKNSSGKTKQKSTYKNISHVRITYIK